MRLRALFSRIVAHIRSHIWYKLFFNYLLVFSVGMIVLSYVTYYLIPNVIEEKNQQYITELNSQISLTTQNNLKELQRVSMMLDYSDDIITLMGDNVNGSAYEQAGFRQSYKNIDSYFINFIYSLQAIHGAYIYNLDGENVYARNVNQAPHRNVKVNEEEWFIRAVQTGGYSFVLKNNTNPYVSDNTPVITLYRLLVDSRSKGDVGVICIEQDITSLGKAIDGMRGNGQSSVILLDAEDNLIYTSDPPLFKKVEKSLPGISSDKSNKVSYVTTEEEEKILISHSVMEGTGWSVLTCEDNAKLQKDLLMIRKTIAIIFTQCLLLAFLISIWLSKKTSANVIKIKSMVYEIEKGNLDAYIEMKGSDEIASLAAGINTMSKRLKHLIEKEYHEVLLRKEAEISLLQAQINPHFLYNTLGLIKNLAVQENAQKTAEMIQRLSRIFRYNAKFRKSMTTVESELEYIDNYLTLQKYRYEDKINVSYKIEETILQDVIPVMILQPIVENAIIHGFENKCGVCTLSIGGYCADNDIKISIEDDGVGMSEEAFEQMSEQLKYDRTFEPGYIPSKIGIYNVNERLKYRFGSAYGLKLYQNSNGGITVELTIPKGWKDCPKGDDENGENYNFDC